MQHFKGTEHIVIGTAGHVRSRQDNAYQGIDGTGYRYNKGRTAKKHIHRSWVHIF